MAGEILSLRALSVTPEYGVGVILIGPKRCRIGTRHILAAYIDNRFGEKGVARGVETILENGPQKFCDSKALVFASKKYSCQTDWVIDSFRTLLTRKAQSDFGKVEKILTDHTPTLGVTANYGLVIEKDEVDRFASAVLTPKEQAHAEEHIRSNRMGCNNEAIDLWCSSFSLGGNPSIEKLSKGREALVPLRLAFNLAWPKIEYELAHIKLP